MLILLKATKSPTIDCRLQIFKKILHFNICFLHFHTRLCTYMKIL